MEKKITQKQFLSVWHFIYYQHRREIRTFLNLTELLASNRIKETYSYYFYIKNRKQKGKKKFKSKFFFSSYEEIVVRIFWMKLDDFYHTGFSNYYLHLYCYIFNVSPKMSFSLLHVFIKLKILYRTSFI